MTKPYFDEKNTISDNLGRNWNYWKRGIIFSRSKWNTEKCKSQLDRFDGIILWLTHSWLAGPNSPLIVRSLWYVP